MLIVALTLSPHGFAAPPDGKGKGKDDPPPPPPPVTYQLNWLDENGVPDSFAVNPDPRNPERRIIPKDMNNLGTVVGYADEGYPWEQPRAFCYDYEMGALINLNDLTENWVDLDVDPGDENRTPTGWIAIESYGVNDHNEIVGTAQHSVTCEQRVFLLHYPNGPFTLLPKVFVDGVNLGRDINDYGVVVARAQVELTDGWRDELIVYTPWSDPPYTPTPVGGASGRPVINNLGAIVSGGILIGPTSDYSEAVITSYPNTFLRDINDLGQMVGKRLSVGNGKNRTPGGPILIDPVAGTEQFVGDGGYAANGINILGDVVSGSGPALLWLQGFSNVDGNGPLILQDLVEPPAEGEFWAGTPWRINDFGQICGYDTVQYRAYVLTPTTLEN